MTSDWEARYRDSETTEPEAAAVLRDNAHLLPGDGTALDVACGLGGNAVFLADQGLETFAWDSAETAIGKLADRAAQRGLLLTAELRDVLAQPPEPERFDVIVVSRFLERGLAPALIDALRPGGVLFYETFTRTRVSDRGPRSERFRLADNELLSLFAPLKPVCYREEGQLGDITRGLRDLAQLVAARPLR